MALQISKEMLEQLEAAQNSALTERKGLIDCSRDKRIVAKAVERWATPRDGQPAIVEARSPIDGKVDENKTAFVAQVMENQLRYVMGKIGEGSFFSRFRLREGEGRLLMPQRSLMETTTSSDIATYTQQVLAFVEPVFERIFIDQLVHMRVMQGPTAFIHTLDFTQGSAGDFYESGTSFTGRLDINYSDCPAECSNFQKVNMGLSQSLVTAVCKGLSADWCLQAEQDYMSQHGRSVGDDLRAFMQLQMARERQGEVLQELVSNAGYSTVWASTIPGGSVYLTLDPKVYQATLYDTILAADNEIFKSADGYRGANWIAGDPDSLLRLEQLKRFAITSRDNVARTQAGTGNIDEFGNFFGTANLRYNLWKFPFMTPDTLLLGVKSDAPQELGFIHAEYIPLADLGVWRNPANGNIVTGMQSRYANAIIRPGLYATVTIT